MQLVKAILAGLVVLAIGTMWTNRAWLVDAYRADEPTASVRLSGVDLAVDLTELEPTPYLLPSAPDSRERGASMAIGLGADAVADAVPPPSLGGGTTRFEGTVVGPDGPVGAAIVRIERHTDTGVATMDAVTGDDGAWVIGPLAGGRYRVRAWVPGLLTMGRSEVRFVTDDELAVFDLEVWGIDPSPVLELVDGGPLYEGVPGSVAVVVGWRSIDLEGLIVTNPSIGAPVTVETTPQVEVVGTQPSFTDATGTAWFELRCLVSTVASNVASNGVSTAVGVEAAGPTTPGAPAVAPAATVAGPAGTLTARTGGSEATFALPGCQPIPEPEPEPEPDPDAAGDAAPDPGDSDAEPTPDPGDSDAEPTPEAGDTGGTDDG